jgi:hypothetical protein
LTRPGIEESESADFADLRRLKGNSENRNAENGKKYFLAGELVLPV